MARLDLKQTFTIHIQVDATIKETVIPLYDSSKEFNTLAELRLVLDSCYNYLSRQVKDN